MDQTKIGYHSWAKKTPYQMVFAASSWLASVSGDPPRFLGLQRLK